MRLDKLRIRRFKNLQNVSVDFDEKSPYTVLVGGNGTGKSNLIEAIAWIFRALDLDEPAPFDYELEYRCRENHIKIEARSRRTPRFEIRRKGEESFSKLSRADFKEVDEEERPLYRPAFVFGYYSGPSDRLAEVFEKHRQQFRKYIIKPIAERTRGPVRSNSLRRLFYTQTVHGQFALLAFFMDSKEDEQDDREFLREHLRIDQLDSVLFVLKEPEWPWGKRKGDPRFWNAEGEVRDLLGRLRDAALAPMRMKRKVPVALGSTKTIENMFLFLSDQTALRKVFEHYRNQYAFFTALESIDISTFFVEVVARIRVGSEVGGGAVTYRDLSEGEQQLLLVLGLLKFTAEDEALFLLDEPDTHLNPAWSVQYLEFLNRFVKRRDNCHILLATHDPLLFASLQREQVRIVRRDVDGAIVIEEPADDPRGMGIEAILTSDLFRLPSTLDPPTQELLDERRRIASKDEPLDAKERQRLTEINMQLRPLAFSKTTRDPLFQLFVEAWTAQEDPSWPETSQLTEEQRLERVALAEKIVAELKAEVVIANDADQP